MDEDGMFHTLRDYVHLQRLLYTGKLVFIVRIKRRIVNWKIVVYRLELTKEFRIAKSANSRFAKGLKLDSRARAFHTPTGAVPPCKLILRCQ